MINVAHINFYVRKYPTNIYYRLLFYTFLSPMKPTELPTYFISTIPSIMTCPLPVSNACV